VSKEHLLLEQWKMASELHRHMDNMAWQRFNYFVATNGLLVTALAAIGKDAFGKDAFGKAPTDPVKVIAIAIPVIGLVVSIVWSSIQCRGQYYQYYRSAQARQTEEALTIDGERILSLYQWDLDEQNLITVPKCAKPRTHDLMYRLALFFAGVWLSSIPFFVCFLFFQH
jgi:hypothetical protein